MKTTFRQAARCVCVAFPVAIAVAGCGGDGPGPDEHGEDAHAHAAPHGGTLVELGDHEANVEIVFDPTGDR